MESDTLKQRVRYHFCQDIAGALRVWTEKEWQSLAKTNGTVPEYLKWEFKNMLRDGLKVLPVGYCEGFNYQTGCPGHPVDHEDIPLQAVK